MRRFCQTIVSVVALFAIAPAAHASVLDLTYSVSPASGGNFHYDFTLTLTNSDGTWVAGQQFDWITFGDRSSQNQPSGFCPNVGLCGASNFFNFSSADPLANLDFSTGGSQGPTISYGANITLPGWQPTAVGSSLSWSGESSILLGSGQMFFSTLVTTQNTSRSQYQLATLVGGVPEPSTWAMMLLGFGGMGLAMRRKGTEQKLHEIA